MGHGKRQQGFTLIELFVTMLVALILVGIGIPSFSSAMKNTRLSKSTNDLITTLHRARSEALKRGRDVRICAGDGDCNSSNWESGWVAFVDENSDGDIDTDEEIIIQQNPQNKNTIRFNGSNINTFGFNGRGKPLNNNVGRFTICDNRPDAGKEVVIAFTGRASSNENNTNCPA